MVYSVTTPAVVILPILLARASVNHKFPSGPAVMPIMTALEVGMGYSVTVPDVLILAILFACSSANHRFPSGPAVTGPGPALEVGTGYSAIPGSACETAGSTMSRPNA